MLLYYHIPGRFSLLEANTSSIEIPDNITTKNKTFVFNNVLSA